jgi:heat shock protein HslJ
LTYPAALTSPLEGVTWISEVYENGHGEIRAPVRGTEISARFKDGVVSGSGGCNTYAAAYTVAGNDIMIARPLCGEIACETPEGIMEQEAAYLAALERARLYRIEGSRLMLQTNDLGLLASYVTAERYLDALATGHVYRRVGDELFLENADGTTVAHFGPAGDDSPEEAGGH